MAVKAANANGSEGFTAAVSTRFQYTDLRSRWGTREEEVVHTIKRNIADLATKHLTEREIEVIRPTKRSELVVTVSSPRRLGCKRQIEHHACLLESDNGFSVAFDHKQRGKETPCAAIVISREFPGAVEGKPNSIVMNIESKGAFKENARISVSIPNVDPAKTAKLVICLHGFVGWVNWKDETNNAELLALIPELSGKGIKDMHVAATRDRVFNILRSMLFFNKTVAEGA